jgi:outer membrane protein assembly factor BamB
MRYPIAVLWGLVAAIPGWSQSLPRSTPAVPPDRAALDRLNLTTDWVFHVPLEGRHDGIARVQLAEESQVFVQTHSGLLLALDAFTGRTLWKFKMPAAYSSHFPVGFNSRYVVAFNVAKMFVLDRYKGALELEFNLPKAPASGPVVDSENVYLALTGSAVQAFALPRELLTPNEAQEAKPDALAGAAATVGSNKVKSPAESVAERFTSRMYPPREQLPSERIQAPDSYIQGGGYLSSAQRTPSLTTLRTVVPPYTIGNLNRTESLFMLPTVSKPYTMTPDYLKYTQRTPSVAMLPSLVRLSEQSSLRNVPLKPADLWTYSTQKKLVSEPVLVTGPSSEGVNLWLVEDGSPFAVVSTTGQPQAYGRLEAAPVSPMAGPYAYTKDQLLGFMALTDGRVMAVDMIHIKGETPVYEWKAKVGGHLNHKPVGAVDGLYVSGDRSGVARIDVKTGEVDWRTEDSADMLLSMNDEHVYVRDRLGNLLIYEKGKVHDRVKHTARSITSMPIDTFNVPVVNAVTDRLYLASDSGLIVSLRDSAPKYARVKSIRPPAVLPPEPKAPAEMKPADPAAPPPAMN